MQDHLKSLNPVDDKLIYGHKYALYMNGKYIGTAIWTQDINVGDSFQTKDERGVSTVYLPDRWELLN